jgi:hypothetical protein
VHLRLRKPEAPPTHQEPAFVPPDPQREDQGLWEEGGHEQSRTGQNPTCCLRNSVTSTLYFIKNHYKSKYWCLTPIILATWEGGIRRIVV